MNNYALVSLELENSWTDLTYFGLEIIVEFQE